MPRRREVKQGGSRFGKLPAERRQITPEQREDEVVNSLRIQLRRFARHVGTPPEEINTKVTRLLQLLREEMRNALLP